MNELKNLIFRNRKLLLWGTLIVAAVIWFLGSSIRDIVHNKLEYKRLEKYSARLDQEYEELQSNLELLEKQDPAYIERLARVQYHMSLPGETEYRFTTK